MTEKLVSVIIPTYKRNWSFLNRAVKSVIEQTYQNIEVIVIDDSPDSFELRQEIKEKMLAVCAVDERVHYLMNEKNLGGSLARNRGISEAKGFYITFLDDDDEYLEEKIQHQAAFMDEHECDLSFEDMVMYNDKDEVVDVRRYNDIKSFDNESLLHYHLLHHLTGTPTFMFKAEKLKEILLIYTAAKGKREECGRATLLTDTAANGKRQRCGRTNCSFIRPQKGKMRNAAVPPSSPIRPQMKKDRAAAVRHTSNIIGRAIWTRRLCIMPNITI